MKLRSYNQIQSLVVVTNHYFWLRFYLKLGLHFKASLNF